MKKLIISLLALAFLLGSCDLTELNKNEKDPSDVPGEPLFSNAQVNMGTFLHNTNVNVNIFKLISQQWTTTTYTAEPRYEIDTRAIPDNVWITLYRDVLVDLQESKAKIKNDEFIPAGEKKNKIATIEVMNVLAYSTLAKIFGDVPYGKEALDPKNTQPSYTDDAEIYENLMSRLNTAIGNFDTNAASFGSADVFYNGDVDKWVKFANSLKMRLAITMADAKPSMAQKAIQNAAPNAFTSNADNALIPFQSSPPTTNPVWEALVQSGRDDYLPANTMVDKMNNLNDPRRPIFITKVDTTDDNIDNPEFVGAPYGEQNDYPAFSHFSSEIERRDRPGMILSYSEVEFILAEAVERGYSVSGTAQSHYNEAIRADMEFWGVSNSDINTYLAQTSVDYSTAPGTWKEKIGTQKWLGSFLQGIQGWTVARRLDYPKLVLPPNAQASAVPTRFTYPADEQNFNEQNYNSAASAIGGDELTTKLFWDQN
ncbi:Starch-binding associating with outer membrane [Fodinibius salinus]|uniref:Starch-binding associating with outer membrane n=1 Tax=Fodinibius salinus TaxID=860790 RepID=A0A5D3YM62_9BACT|nr:SusD/RagB family nutrient-binding outer membrane lipoprotein [Fodinibius salinus]TYP94026.1 Starch-binding associating with outer membrane [Fodinibius salinus]